MADITHRVGGEEYGTWTIPKDQIKKGYRAARGGEEIDNDLLDEMSSIRYYSYTNKDTQEVEVRRVDGDTYVGTLYTNTSSTKPNTPFTVDKEASGRIDIEASIFNDKDAQKTLKEQTKKGMIKDVTKNGIPDKAGPPPDPEAAENYVDNTLNNNFEDTNPNSNKIPNYQPVETKSTPINFKAGDKKGTRTTFEKNLKYPISLSKTQDTLKIDMLKYTTKEMIPGGTSFGGGDRSTNKDIIGTVVLPIPGGIRDADRVNWGEDSMNALQMAAAGVALKSIADGPEGAGRALTNIGKKMRSSMEGGGGDIKDAVSNWFSAAAIGKDFSKLMSRTQGQVMNPNMELLFSGPTLRPFSFNFLLAPRSKLESEMVMKIIRFFKQGMAPIRSGSNLFLKAPHTFQLTYRNGEQSHKYLNSFKECALTSCEINYTPEQNYSTYEDGVMTAYTMALSFKELEPVFNDDYGGKQDVPNLNFESTTDDYGQETVTNPATPTTTTPTTTAPPSAYTTTAPSGQGAGPMASDMKLKENINKVGISPSGINIYEWNYIGKPQRYRGVIAQEIMEVIPKAVTTMENGFLGVYYNLIDVNMELV